IPPCLQPVAVSLTVTSANAAGGLAGSFVLAPGYSSPLPCTQSPGTTCMVLGSLGTYELDVGAPGFKTTHRTVVVSGTSAECGCPDIDTQHVDVQLEPAP
ncbi:MAG: hypothetical protein ABI625_12885, partial [bacterium]